MKKKIKIILICVATLVVIAAGLVVLKTVLSSKGTEKVYYTANVDGRQPRKSQNSAPLL